MSDQPHYPTDLIGRSVEVTAAQYVARKYHGILLSIDANWIVLRSDREEIFTFPTVNVEYVKSITKL